MKPHASQIVQPGLYLVATPIGNLGDITLRALETLKAADLIACEDTRVSAKLLNHYGIKKPCLSYNDHNGATRRPQILEKIRNGKKVALISDAGTPLISDPGYKLVKAAQEEGLYVTMLPGASSVLAALSLSGLPSDAFFFAGFLPTKKQALEETAQKLAAIPATLICFESARRLPETLGILYKVLGNREAAVARELTKLYEETRRDTLEELYAYYQTAAAPKGEIVLVISPPQPNESSAGDIKKKLKLLLKDHSVKEAASIVAEESGKPRREIYSLALSLMDNAHD